MYEKQIEILQQIPMIGVIGTRQRHTHEAYKKIRDAVMKEYKPGNFLVSGGCPKGGDRIAEIIASNYGIPLLIWYPNWTVNKKGAGYARNIYIAKTASKELVAAVSSNRKGGTEDTIKKWEAYWDRKDTIIV